MYTKFTIWEQSIEPRKHKNRPWFLPSLLFLFFDIKLFQTLRKTRYNSYSRGYKLWTEWTDLLHSFCKFLFWNKRIDRTARQVRYCHVKTKTTQFRDRAFMIKVKHLQHFYILTVFFKGFLQVLSSTNSNMTKFFFELKSICRWIGVPIKISSIFWRTGWKFIQNNNFSFRLSCATN